MNNKSKKLIFINYVILCVFMNFVFSQNLESFIQKTSLENSLRDKIYSEVGHIIDKTKFVVIVNLELDYDSQFQSTDVQKLNDNSLEESSFSQSNSSINNSMEFIPGFQLSGPNNKNNTNDSKTQKLGFENTSNNSLGKLGSMKIKKIGVSFFLEESIASPALDKTITTLVNGIIPMIANCEDCISIETMQFQKSSEKSELAQLRDKIEIMERERREAEILELDKKFDDLREKLARSEDQREMWEEQAILDREFQRRQDSLRLAKLEAKEDAERVQLDTLLLKAQNKIDTVISARIQSETETKKDLIDIIKYGQGNLSDEDNQGILGMRGGTSSDNTLIYLIFGSMIFIMFMLLLFKKGKQEVVYLKPKGASKKKSKKEVKKTDKKNDTEDKKTDGEEEKSVELDSNSQSPLMNPYASMAFEDENVVRAELKALRQSAVSMSVNQQEGATQIIKDWLSDGSDGAEEADGEEG